MTQNNLIVLLTDFGLSDPYVGVMKGVIKNINPGVDIVDLTHEIRHQSITEAAFCLMTSYKYFPQKSIFVCVVDPGVGSERKIILISTDKYYFLAPDNGLVSWAIENEPVQKIIWVKNSKYFLKPVSSTFHGRDIFAPAAAHLSLGLKPDLLGEEIKDIVRIPFPKPVSKDNVVTGEIIFVDHFGNLVTNISRDITGRTQASKVSLNGKTMDIKDSYQSVCAGKPLAVIGSSGYLEVSVRNGDASRYFSSKEGTKVELKVS
jgi:hypothetical protein